jgi:hypothetical protein
VVVQSFEGCNQPLPDVTVQVQDQIADAIAGIVRPPPHLFVAQSFDATSQSWPVLLEQLLSREFEKLSV